MNRKKKRMWREGGKKEGEKEASEEGEERQGGRKGNIKCSTGLDTLHATFN